MIYTTMFVKTGRIHEQGAYGRVVSSVVHVTLSIIKADTDSERTGSSAGSLNWANTGGSAIAGDDAWATCQKAFWEELGIEATKDIQFCYDV